MFGSLAEAGVGCPLLFSPSGAMATLVAGQSCTATSGSETDTETFTNGSATLSASTLTFYVEFDFSTTPPSVAGSASTHATCTKL